MSFKDFIDKLIDQTKQHKLNWKKRDLLKPHKLQLLALVPHIVKEMQASESKEDAYENVVDFISKRDGLSQHLKTFRDSELLKQQVQSFDECYKHQLEFNPSSGAVSAITSQEIIKVITRRDFPEHGLFLFDATTQKMMIEKMA